MNVRQLLCVLLLCPLIGGCASRYRLPLYLDIDNTRKNLKIEQTQYLLNARLGDPYDEQKVISGAGKCLVLLTSTRGDKIELPAANVLAFDEYLKIRLFIELPDPITPGTIDLKGHSFAQLMGRYTLQPDEKIFLPSVGKMVIDSIAKDHLFASIGAKFTNSSGRPIQFDGQFRARVRD